MKLQRYLPDQDARIDPGNILMGLGLVAAGLLVDTRTVAAMVRRDPVAVRRDLDALVRLGLVLMERRPTRVGPGLPLWARAEPPPTFETVAMVGSILACLPHPTFEAGVKSGD